MKNKQNIDELIEKKENSKFSPYIKFSAHNIAIALRYLYEMSEELNRPIEQISLQEIMADFIEQQKKQDEQDELLKKAGIYLR